MAMIVLFGLLIVAVVVLIVTLVLNMPASKKAEKERTYSPEELYTEIVRLVSTEKYQEACDLWHANEKNEQFSLDYKDLSSYYHYAAALKGYIGAEESCLNEVKTELEQVAPDFKRASYYQKEIAALNGSVYGTYVKTAPAAAEYRLEIHDDGTADMLYNQPQNYITVNYIKHEKIVWTIEGGSLCKGKVSGGPYFFALTPVEDGIQVEDRRQFGNDLEMCGVYVRREEEEEPETSEESEEA